MGLWKGGNSRSFFIRGEEENLEEQGGDGQGYLFVGHGNLEPLHLLSFLILRL